MKLRIDELIRIQHGLMNHPSECTIKAIGEYFANGTLPEVGTVCDTDMTGFEYAAANPLV